MVNWLSHELTADLGLFILPPPPPIVHQFALCGWGDLTGLVPRSVCGMGTRLDQFVLTSNFMHAGVFDCADQPQCNRKPGRLGPTEESTFHSDTNCVLENCDPVTTVRPTDEAMVQRVLFEVRVPGVSAKEEVCISGNVRALGEWAVHRSVPMTRRDG